ncbi:hypothetical protein ACLOJK_025119 [Asimina triloba]
MHYSIPAFAGPFGSATALIQALPSPLTTANAIRARVRNTPHSVPEDPHHSSILRCYTGFTPPQYSKNLCSLFSINLDLIKKAGTDYAVDFSRYNTLACVDTIPRTPASYTRSGRYKKDIERAKHTAEPPLQLDTGAMQIFGAGKESVKHVRGIRTRQGSEPFIYHLKHHINVFKEIWILH